MFFDFYDIIIAAMTACSKWILILPLNEMFAMAGMQLPTILGEKLPESEDKTENEEVTEESAE